MTKKNLLPIFLAVAGALYLLRWWGQRLGATLGEFQQAFPGDELVSHPDLESTHAVTIQAAPEAIWPWIVQMGYYRGGWYTDSTWRDWDYYPDKLLRFFVREQAEQSGVGHREAPSATQAIPEFQSLKVGDVVLDGPPGTAFFTVAAVEPNQYLVLYSNSHLRFLFPKSIRENSKIGVGGELTWAFYLQRSGETGTRVILRTRGRIQPWWYRTFISLTLPIADLFLSRKMLGGIKKRAEGPLQ